MNCIICFEGFSGSPQNNCCIYNYFTCRGCYSSLIGCPHCFDGISIFDVVKRGGAMVECFIEKYPESVNTKDKDGVTALMYATQKDLTDIIEILIENGADVCARDKNGMMALMSSKCKKMTKLHIKHGAYFFFEKSGDFEAEPPLALNDEEIVDLLIEERAKCEK